MEEPPDGAPTHLFECLQRTLTCLTARYAAHPEGMGNALGGVQMSNEVVRLKDEGNMLTRATVRSASLAVPMFGPIFSAHPSDGESSSPNDREERRFSAPEAPVMATDSPS